MTTTQELTAAQVSEIIETFDSQLAATGNRNVAYTTVLNRPTILKVGGRQVRAVLTAAGREL